MVSKHSPGPLDTVRGRVRRGDREREAYTTLQPPKCLQNVVCCDDDDDDDDVDAEKRNTFNTVLCAGVTRQRKVAMCWTTANHWR